MTVYDISNWIFLAIGIGIVAYLCNEKTTVYIAVRDKKNKIHKIAVYTTDSDEEVMKKINQYMSKNQ